MSLGVGQRSFGSPREQEDRNRRENGDGRSGASQQGPCALTQGVEGGHLGYFGRWGFEY